VTVVLMCNMLCFQRSIRSEILVVSQTHTVSRDLIEHDLSHQSSNLLMGAYLLSVDNDNGQVGAGGLAGVIVGAIIVACTWSTEVAPVVAFSFERDY
jgi:hypothetical protein